MPKASQFFCYVRQDVNQPDFTYVGYTVNPERRGRQHNGEIKGGAKCLRGRKTRLAILVRGFPSATYGLSFERAVKNVSRSIKKLKGLERRREAIRRVMGGKWKHSLPEGTLEVIEMSE